jgi:phosphate uptake regulator
MPDTGQETSTRRSRSRRSTNTSASPAARRSRGPREPLDLVLTQLDQMISALIKENRDLKRQVDRASRQTISDSSGTADRLLRSIQRRITRAGDSDRTSSRRRSVAAAPPSRTRRKITDPEVLERRRQALAKARAARAAKRATAS